MKTALSSLLSVAALALAVPLMAQAEQTASGKVVSSTPEQLVVQTDAGSQLTFNVDSQSTVPAGLNAGSRVTVTYHDMGGGTLHAARVDASTGGGEPMNTQETTPPKPTTMAPAYTPPAATTTSPATSAAQEPARAPTTGASTSTMPATASPLPLVGLLGLLSLGAGLGVRALRRSA